MHSSIYLPITYLVQGYGEPTTRHTAGNILKDTRAKELHDYTKDISTATAVDIIMHNTTT